MILVDTSAWIDYFNGTESPVADALDLALDEDPVLIGDLIYCELLQGFKENKAVYQVQLLLSNLQRCDLGGFDIAHKAAENYRFLRKKGVTIRKTIDVLIATYCIENNIRLLHNDQDFTILQKHLPLKTVPVVS